MLKFTVSNEMHVREFFSANLEMYGYSILVSQAEYPDYTLEDRDGKTYRVEVEYASANFILHRHKPSDCDFILCWRHNAKSVLPVLELESGVWYQPGEINPEKDSHIELSFNKKNEEKVILFRESIRGEYDLVSEFFRVYSEYLMAYSQYSQMVSIPYSQLSEMIKKELSLHLQKAGFDTEKITPESLLSFLVG